MVHRVTVGQNGSISDSPGGYGNREHIIQNKNQQTNTIFNYFQNNTTTQQNTHQHHQQNQKQQQQQQHIDHHQRSSKRKAIDQSTNSRKKQSRIYRNNNIGTSTSHKRTYNEVEASAEIWGDQFESKPPNTYRLCFENINGLGFEVSHNIKQDRFITWARENEIDVMGWAELNINWRLATPSEKLRERLRPGAWDKLQLSTAHNIHEKLTKYQPGGVSLISFDQIAHRVSSSGSDPSGLGRWTWHSIRCKTRNIRIITAYQPNITVGDEKQTVYAQHKRYLRYIRKSNLCPREAFRSDLTAQLQEWQAKGELLVIMMDVNDDLRDGITHRWLTESMGLINCLHTRHSTLQPPSTYSRNFRNKPIDGCYISPELSIQRGGFLPFRDGIGDHRILYIDVVIDT